MNARVKSSSGSRQRIPHEAGFAYLMALFAVLLMAAASLVVLTNLQSQGRRQKEAETIWRGEQYERAIKSFFHKTGHYPHDVDELQKGLPGIHFLRYAAYKDPMNKQDGAWRFIYLNAAGQIIGSVKYASLQQMALLDQPGGPQLATQIPGQPGVPVSSLTSSGSNGSDAQQGQNPPSAPDGAAQNQQNTPQAGQGPQQPGLAQPTTTFGQPNNSGVALGGAQSAAVLLALKPTGPVDGPVIGGFLTGVASKVDKKSVKIYKNGKKYNQWEFIWNPLEEQLQATQQALSGQGSSTSPGIGQAIGSAFGSAFGNQPQPGGPGGPTSPQPQPQPMPMPQPQPPQMPPGSPPQ
jgi:type II secretory pathway pseudopilin PulG